MSQLSVHAVNDAADAQSVLKSLPGEVPFQGQVGVRITSPSQASNNSGLLVIVHGLGSDWDEHDRLAENWAEEFDVHCLQLRDRHAGPRGLQPPMDLGKYQTIDLLRAVCWAIGNLSFNHRRLFVWGGSGGGHMVLQAAIMAPELFTQAIACCPYTTITRPGEIAGDWCDGWVRMLVERGSDLDNVPRHELDIRSPLLHTNRLSTPLLLLHGDSDAVVSVEHSRALAAAMAASVDFRYVEIPGGDHDFFGGPPGLSSRKEATETLAETILKGIGRLGGNWASTPFAGVRLILNSQNWPTLVPRDDATPTGRTS